MLQFQGFKPEAMQRIAGTLGYQGDMQNFQQFLAANPDKQAFMDSYTQQAMNMVKGGAVKKFVDGGIAFDEPYVGMPPNGIDTNDALSKLRSSVTPQQISTGYDLVNPINQPSIGVNANTGDVSYNYTYEQAVARQSQRDVKSPEEAAAIQAALQAGPMTDDGIFIPVQVATTPEFIRSELNREQSAQTDGASSDSEAPQFQDFMAEQAYNPTLPQGGVVNPMGIGLQDQQFISPTSGQLSTNIQADVSTATTAQAQQPDQIDAAKYDATTVADKAKQEAAAVQGQQTQLSDEAQVEAQQQETSSVSNVEAAQGTGILMNNPVQRKLENGELVTGVADAQTASKYTEQVQAAQATPTKQATVKGQLEGLMQDFEGGQTPAWAAGAMRAATAAMTARGLGASSMAGQAIIQAAMESALPIAQADAATRAAFEAQNLSNRQERAMLAAQQRAAFIGMEFDQAFQARVMNASKVSDIANMNFTAEQQVALENSRIANTMNLQNLNNRQAVVMSEAAALSQLDMANLNNRQQAAVMNAQNFLQVDMANLNNRQQAEMFRAQAIQQALFTDQAAENAAKQFNATSENQTNQFFANLKTQTEQFNAAQSNAQSQFNAGETNAISRFNAELVNQRQQFNAKNRLIIDQNNVQWRREVATANTQAVNRANELNAKAVLDMNDTAMNNLWQYYSDSMEYAWTSAENERDRVNKLAQIKLQGDIKADITGLQNDYNSSVAFGQLIGTFLTGGFKPFSNLFGG